MFIGPCIILIVEEWKTNLTSLAILFHFLFAQHVSDINISIIRSLRLCWWITISVVFFSVRCVLELLVRLVLGGVRFAGWSTTLVLLMMDILMSQTCWAHKKWNKIASDIKLVFHSSTINRTLPSPEIGWDKAGCRKSRPCLYSKIMKLKACSYSYSWRRSCWMVRIRKYSS